MLWERLAEAPPDFVPARLPLARARVEDAVDDFPLLRAVEDDLRDAPPDELALFPAPVRVPVEALLEVRLPVPRAAVERLADLLEPPRVPEAALDERPAPLFALDDFADIARLPLFVPDDVLRPLRELEVPLAERRELEDDPALALRAVAPAALLVPPRRDADPPERLPPLADRARSDPLDRLAVREP